MGGICGGGLREEGSEGLRTRWWIQVEILAQKIYPLVASFLSLA